MGNMVWFWTINFKHLKSSYIDTSTIVGQTTEFFIDIFILSWIVSAAHTMKDILWLS